MEDGEVRCDENQTEADGFAVCCVVLPLTRIELPLALGARLGDRAPGVCVCGPEMGTEPFVMYAFVVVHVEVQRQQKKERKGNGAILGIGCDACSPTRRWLSQGGPGCVHALDLDDPD